MAAMGWWEKSRIHQALKRIVAGPGIAVDPANPLVPVVSAKISTDASNALSFGTDNGLFATGGGGGGSIHRYPGAAFSSPGVRVPITGTLTATVQINYSGKIQGWSMTGDGSIGNAKCDVLSCTAAGFPGSLTSLFPVGVPAIAADDRASAMGLSIPVTAGDILQFKGYDFVALKYLNMTLDILET